MSWIMGRFPGIGNVNGRRSGIFLRPIWSGETNTLDLHTIGAVLDISLGQSDLVR
jgi:hypothetical protein